MQHLLRKQIILLLILFLKLVLNPDFKFLDPLTYVNESNWSKLEFIFTVIELLLIPTALYINSKFGKRLKEWLLKITIQQLIYCMLH